jgi:hypothetical protein
MEHEEKQNAVKQITAIREKIEQTSVGLMPWPTGHQELRELWRHSEADIENRLKEAKKEFQVLNQQATKEIDKIPLWNKDIGSLEILPIPQQETLDRFEHSAGEQQLKLERIKIAINTAEAKIRKLKTNLTTLEVSGEIPTEGDLLDARSHRQEGWKLVRQAWIEMVTVDEEALVFDPLSPLDIAYEKSVEKARREFLDRPGRRQIGWPKMTWLAELQQHEEELRVAAEDAIFKQQMIDITDQWNQLFPSIRNCAASSKRNEGWSITNKLWSACPRESATMDRCFNRERNRRLQNNLFLSWLPLAKLAMIKNNLWPCINIADKIIKSHDSMETQREYLKEVSEIYRQLVRAADEQKYADSQMSQ